MKHLFCIFLYALVLNASGLESMLSTGSLENIEVEHVVRDDNYYCPLIFKKYHERIKTEVTASLKENADSRDISNAVNILNAISDRYNSTKYYDRERREKQIKSESLKDINEVKILPYLKLTYYPNNAPKFEKIIISFNIDDDKNIQNLNFIKRSIFRWINQDLIRAIKQARFDFIQKEKEDITLYYKLMYK